MRPFIGRRGSALRGAVARRDAVLRRVGGRRLLDHRAHDIADRLNPVADEVPLLAVPLLEEHRSIAFVVLAGDLDGQDEAAESELREALLGHIEVLEAPAYLRAGHPPVAVLGLGGPDRLDPEHRIHETPVVEDLAEAVLLRRKRFAVSGTENVTRKTCAGQSIGRHDSQIACNMSLGKLVDSWQREEEQPFSGWDFSWLDGRMFEEKTPWSYSLRAAELLRRCSSVIDLGTGGGERFLELKEFWPEEVVATEEFAPNLKLAASRLAPLGARVADVRLTACDPVPFPNSRFDLVLNRHSAFNPNEVARILTTGGTFPLTQQVHGLWAYDLLAAFGVKPKRPGSTLEGVVAQLRTTGLTILNAEEWSGQVAFADVGAVVYYLKAVPWLVPGFSVETHVEHLLRLQQRLDSGDELAFTARKFLIEAQKETPT